MSWIAWHNPTLARGTDTKYVDALAETAPTIMAAGLFGDCRSHYSVFGPEAPDGPSECRRMNPAVPMPFPPRHSPVAPREYAVPSVAEIREMTGSNGLVVASTFAGAGGSSTGYRWAGYDVRYANEYLDDAADCYRANWPTTHLDRRDARSVSGADILEACGVDDLDILDGSPPCQPFSMAGRREHNWNRTYEHGDGTVNAGGSEDLVHEWLRLVEEVRPRAAVMENVRGLAVGKAKGYLVRVLDDLRSAGYRAGAKLLDAQYLGTPQRRVRVYIVAVRDDLERDPVFPRPQRSRYTVADACPWLRDTDQHADSPPNPRKLTILEVKRLSGFPDDYALVGNYAEQWARLGNSVPPPMARAVGLALLPVLRR